MPSGMQSAVLSPREITRLRDDVVEVELNMTPDRPLIYEMKSIVKSKPKFVLEDLFDRKSPYVWLHGLTVFLVMNSTVTTIVFLIYALLTPTVTQCREIFNEDPLHVFVSAVDACKQLPGLVNETGCQPHLESEFNSVFMEFGLYCEDAENGRNWIFPFQMGGIVAGGLFFGFISDRWGRRFTLLISVYGGAIFYLLSSMSSNLIQFCVLRCIVGFFAGGTAGTQQVYLIEMIRARNREVANAIIAWAPNFLIIPGIAYLCQTWKVFSYYGTTINVVAGFCLWFCSESPRFLIGRGRFDQARSAISHIRKINRDNCNERSDQIERMLLKEEKEWLERPAGKFTFYHNLCWPSMKRAKVTLTLGFGLVILSLINYGIMFNSEKLSGSIYANNAILSGIRWAVVLSVPELDKRVLSLGRKATSTFFSTIVLILLILLFSITYLDLHMPETIKWSSIMVTAACGQLYVTRLMVVSEVYPTSMRTLGNSFASTLSRVGTMFATSIFSLGKFHASIPFGLLSTLVVVDIILFIIWMPETKGVELPSEIRQRRNQ